MPDTDSKLPVAKKYSLDLPRYASIEFPLKVVNDERAIAMIGGKERIQKSLVDKNVQLQLKLRPNDPYLHPINSDISTTENVLVKIRLPKGELLRHGNDIAKTINANKSTYHFEPVAIINKNFKFRELADFQSNMATNVMLQEASQTFLGGDFAKLKNFKEMLTQKDQYDTSKPLDLPPFATFSKIRMPFSYNFTNNKGVAVKSGDGTMRLVNTKQPLKVHTSFVPWDAPAPVSPTAALLRNIEEAEKSVERLISEKKLSMDLIKTTTNYQLVECVKLLEKLFDQKPIWIRKHLYAIIPSNLRKIFKYALAYVAYSTRTGPWKQSYIKFGVDPKDADIYALYQTERFRVHTANKLNDDDDVNDKTATSTEIDESMDNNEIKKLPYEYIFDGTNIPTISTFQLIDIKDPDLKSLLTEDAIVNKVSERDGWFKAQNLLQLRLAMRYKLTCLVTKEPLSKSKLEQIKELAVNRHNSKTGQQKVKKLSSSDEESEDDDDEDDDDEDDEEEEGEIEEDYGSKNEGDESLVVDGDLISRFQKADPATFKKLQGILNQEDLMDIDTK